MGMCSPFMKPFGSSASASLVSGQLLPTGLPWNAFYNGINGRIRAGRFENSRRLAAEDAKARAQALASALGAQLGRGVSITETAIPQPVPMARTAAFAEATAVPVAAGELEITVQIQVTWELR